MGDILYWVKFILSRVVYWLLHAALALYYRGKKRIVPPIKNPLLLKSACTLAAEIREGKLRSEDVVQAYIDRISEVNPYLNAIVQDRFFEALEEAREVDKIINEGKFPKQQLADEKPFFGVPFTIKLLIKVKGLACTAGCKLFQDQISTEDAPCVALIKRAGGIILANTNSPEFGFSLECFNLLHGQTCNPYNTTRTSGGSSGGESALLGAGASVIGIGNDMVGSVRIPAHFTGIFSHKPSMGLVSNTGTFPVPMPDVQKNVFSGPMCRYPEDLTAMMKLLSEDSKIVHKFGQKVDFRKLKIFYSTGNTDPKMLPVDKEIADAMLKAVSYFTDNYGIVAEEMRIPLLDMSTEVSLHYLNAANSKTKNLIKYVTLGKVKSVGITLEILKGLIGKSTFSFPTISLLIIEKFPSIFMDTNDSYYDNILAKVKNIFDDILDENAIFIYPTYPLPAPYHYEMTFTLPFHISYTCIFNFSGHPSTHCPLGINKDGLPYGMQIIGGMNKDYLTISCAEELSKVFGGWIPPNKV